MIKGVRLLWGLVFSGFCLWLVLSGAVGGTSAANIMERLRKVDPIWASIAIGSLILNYPVNSLRLKYVLSHSEASTCSFFQVLPIVWVNSFLSMAMPSAAFSDGIRATLLRAARISNLSLAIRSVLVDRSIGLICTLGLAGILLLILPGNINPGISNYWGFVFLAGFLTLSVVIHFGSKLVNRIKLFARLRNLFGDMNRLMSNPKAVGLFLSFVVPNAIISALSLWCISRGFAVNLNLWMFFMLTPAILIVNNLPIFYQGFGGREATMLFAFGNSSSGMPPDLISTISLTSGVAMIVSALIGSIFLPFLLLRRNSSP